MTKQDDSNGALMTLIAKKHCTCPKTNGTILPICTHTRYTTKTASCTL